MADKNGKLKNPKRTKRSDPVYFLYILRCTDGSLYTGITVDLDRRLAEHNSSRLGSKYTRSRRPVKLVYSQKFADRGDSSKEEARIKGLSRAEKLTLLSKLA